MLYKPYWDIIKDLPNDQKCYCKRYNHVTARQKKRFLPDYEDCEISYICFMNKRDKIINRISSVLTQKYPDAEIYLYGSRARGDAKPFSDWDLLVLLNFPSVTFSLATNIMDDLYEIELETGEIISPLIYSKKEWGNKHKTPLFENIEKESIKIK